MMKDFSIKLITLTDLNELETEFSAINSLFRQIRPAQTYTKPFNQSELEPK